MADPNGGAGGAPAPPYGLQPPLEQGELEEEKVKGEEEEKEEGFSPPYGCDLDPPLPKYILSSQVVREYLQKGPTDGKSMVNCGHQP